VTSASRGPSEVAELFVQRKIQAMHAPNVVRILF